MGILDELLIFCDFSPCYRVYDRSTKMLNIDLMLFLGDTEGLEVICLWHPCGRVFIVNLLTDEVHCLLGDHVGTADGHSIG